MCTNVQSHGVGNKIAISVCVLTQAEGIILKAFFTVEMA